MNDNNPNHIQLEFLNFGMIIEYTYILLSLCIFFKNNIQKYTIHQSKFLSCINILKVPSGTVVITLRFKKRSKPWYENDFWLVVSEKKKMHKITHTCTCYVTNKNLISIFRWKKVIQPWFEQTWVTLLRTSLNKLEIRSLQTKYEWFLVSGFYRRFFRNWPKIAQNYP